MREIQTFLRSCNAWLREDISFGGEIEFIRQGIPPDKSYTKAQEELAETVSHANRRAEIQAWELIRNYGQLARETGAKQNPSGSAFVP
jgi:hypothetical protein